MATKVHMEALSPTMEEGQVVKWHKAEGDNVAQGELLAEIETDKATMELVARGDGVLRRILKGEGETAPVGDVIAVIAGAGEDISALVGSAGDNGAAPEPAKSKSDQKMEAPEAAAAAPAPAAKSAAPAAPAAAAPAAPTPAGEGGRLKASPLARRLAAESGVELTGLRGSGPGGRI